MSGPGKLLLAALVCAVALGAPPAVNPDAALVQDFHTRLDNYMKLRKPLVAKLKPTNSQAAIVGRQRNLAADLRALNSGTPFITTKPNSSLGRSLSAFTRDLDRSLAGGAAASPLAAAAR